jgi:hypothetical protein
MRGGRSTPTDLTPSPANRTIPQEVTAVSIYDKGWGPSFRAGLRPLSSLYANGSVMPSSCLQLTKRS